MKMKRSIRINAKGKQLNRFINAIHQHRIDCQGQFCRGEVFHCDIYRRDLKELQDIAKNCGIELKTAEYDSLSARLFRYRRRFGLLIGILLAFTAALYFSQVVVTIEIEGNSVVSDEVILSALEELNIKAGTPVCKINIPYCENKLRLMIDDVAWAGIRHTGSRLVVQVTEVEHVPEMLLDRVPCNIVASRNAEISSILVRSGQLKHIVGDYVPKGTILISGVDETENGRTFVHHAMGDIRGIYEENVSFSAPFHAEEALPTGRTDTQRTLRLFSLDIPLYFGKSNYSSPSETKEKNAVIFGHELPLGIKTRTVSETAVTEKDYTEEELTEKLMERVYLYENNFLGNGTKILSRDITTETNGDALTLRAAYRLEGNICEQRDIFIK
ncbi:sporulation protein YqfD [Ruminococcus flavefaciens]|uniref:sporulation protein YqfD n=1 Tax=Ruminococcus flavefaciens TaxID=1265 RepID=UPI00048F707F|nr:sporulation protein YqfD [Ruminococcus flavefaciens]